MIWFVLIVVSVEVFFKPRIDFTRDGDTMIWYGRRNRKYFRI